MAGGRDRPSPLDAIRIKLVIAASTLKSIPSSASDWLPEVITALSYWLATEIKKGALWASTAGNAHSRGHL